MPDDDEVLSFEAEAEGREAALTPRVVAFLAIAALFVLAVLIALHGWPA
jgi:hypothetical protein